MVLNTCTVHVDYVCTYMYMKTPIWSTPHHPKLQRTNVYSLKINTVIEMSKKQDKKFKTSIEMLG